ncbi:MAG: hypothetical protein ABI468_08730 [Candidatus Nanopelagicales bacterium]
MGCGRVERWVDRSGSCRDRARLQALVLVPLAAATPVEPNRLQRGLFIAAVVVVMGAVLWWLRRRGDAARWRQRRGRVYADAQAVERDSGGVCDASNAAAAAASWATLEPRILICVTELTQLARTGPNQAQVADVNRVRAALEQLSDQLRRIIAAPDADDTGPEAQAARRALLASLAPPS